MVTCKGILVLLLLAAVGSSLAFNYCNDNLTKCCGHQHIACQNNNKFGPQCKPSAKIIPMTPKMIDFILHAHNEGRNLFANGTYGFPSAVRLGVMTWDIQLANVAQYNVRQCNPVMDQCRNTPTYRFVGQNIGISDWKSYEQQYGVEEVILHQIRQWISSRRFATTQDLVSYPFEMPENNFGHFTVMMHQKSNKVGCAVELEAEADGFMRQAITCNYSHDNVVGQPTYQAGPTAAWCTSGTDPVYTNLCTSKDVYLSNNIGM